jgi:hypothetical protein
MDAAEAAAHTPLYITCKQQTHETGVNMYPSITKHTDHHGIMSTEHTQANKMAKYL